MIEVLALQAIALQAQGDPSAALLALQRALTLAEPEGYVRCFVDEGAPMATVLRQAQARGVAGHYVGTLLAAFGAATGPAAKSPLPVHEALTPRELTILQLVAAGLSVDEIAERAIIAPGTVRNHLKSIYGKLDAHSRLQAVERARALHLL
jgi:LuxR family maltose regulon positive regulatory protein